MKHNLAIRRMSSLGAAVATVLMLAAPATAQPPGMSQEEMQRMIQERQVAGGGYGMGSGMMMGGGGMGMMGGGMMDMMMGGGMGGVCSGMMMGGGMGMMGMFNLSDEQRAKVRKLEDEQRKKNRDLYGKIEDESVKLRDLYDTDTPDARKIGAAYDKIFDLKRQAIVSAVEAQNKARAVLTKEQQEQLKAWRRGGMGMGGYGPRGGGMGPGMMGR